MLTRLRRALTRHQEPGAPAPDRSPDIETTAAGQPAPPAADEPAQPSKKSGGRRVERERSDLHDIPPASDATVHRLTACPVCTHDQWTIICEWNKLLLDPKMADAAARRYDFAVCHRCGVLFASVRPAGERYRYLLDNFIESSGKLSKTLNNPVLNPYPLSASDREELRARIKHGVFVSDHTGLSSGEYLTTAFKDRIELSMHTEILSSLLPLDGASVLELRPRTGAILVSLRRLHDTRVYAMPLFESQQLVLQELYGIEASERLDFERFRISYAPRFDLIISHHVLTHAICPRDFLAELRAHLAPGGHLYLYDELDDAEFTDGTQSMIATLNPFHFQTADRRSFQRILEANGFEVVFQKSIEKRHVCLARRNDAVEFVPARRGEIKRRIAALRQARDRALLKLPAAARQETGEDWGALTERAIASGLAVRADDGAVKVVRPHRD